MSTDDPFAGSAGLPSISFATKDEYGNLGSKPVGTRIGGKVLKAPSLAQRRNFTTKLAEFWPDGNPKMSVVVDLDVDGVEMSLWVKKPSALFKAFGDAIAGAGGVPVGPGAFIWVTLIGFGKPEADQAPAKLYKVEYTPANSFEPVGPTPAGATSPAPPAPPAPPAAAVTATEPVLSNGFTASALKASGWNDDQIAALSAPAPVAAPPAPPAPPAATPTPSERQAKLDAMSPEDRALLNL